MTTPDPQGRGDTERTAGHSRLYSALIGMSALAILLQGVWAGIFLEHDGQREAAGTWIDVHARGAEVALVLSALATLVAFLKLRHRTEIWIGTGVLTLLIIVESFLGGRIRDDGQDTLTIVHVPLAMSLTGLAIWLPVRARRR
jgi:hypothetical protein